MCCHEAALHEAVLKQLLTASQSNSSIEDKPGVRLITLFWTTNNALMTSQAVPTATGQRWEKEGWKEAAPGQFNQSTADKMEVKADGYLLVVSEAQSRHVSILLSKVGQPADHPCKLGDAGRIKERKNEREKINPTKNHSRSRHAQAQQHCEKRGRKTTVQSLDTPLEYTHKHTIEYDAFHTTEYGVFHFSGHAHNFCLLQNSSKR